MGEETRVTRGSQITLTKDVREKMHVKEGDSVILNLLGEVLMVSKRDAKVFDDFDSFLSSGFDKTLVKLRRNSQERLKKLGVVA